VQGATFLTSGGEEHRHRENHKMRIPLGMIRGGGGERISGAHYVCQ
jgi:hypothetical protein